MKLERFIHVNVLKDLLLFSCMLFHRKKHLLVTIQQFKIFLLQCFCIWNEMRVHTMLKNSYVLKLDVNLQFFDEKRHQSCTLLEVALVMQNGMEQMDFSCRWGMWIHGCLNSAYASVLVNGSPTKEFKIEKGLRQGDPVSRFLFIIAVHGSITYYLTGGKIKK